MNCVKDKEVRFEVWKDVDQLQLANSPGEFKLLCDSFLKKWKAKRMGDVNLFLTYFETNWIRQNSNWFEGAAPGYPSSNNALEGTNNDMILKIRLHSENVCQ